MVDVPFTKSTIKNKISKLQVIKHLLHDNIVTQVFKFGTPYCYYYNPTYWVSYSLVS